jgi:riboflavin synthase
MFTGLIETVGQITHLEKRGPGIQMAIRAPLSLVSELVLGESVAVNGACLTVTHTHNTLFYVDASSETMDKTTLGYKKTGDSVHLERALRVGDRLGGHWVSGHVDSIGYLRSRTQSGEAWEMWIDAPPAVMKYIVNKGSIAIDGASLTVNALDDAGFSITLIPHSQSILLLSQYTLRAPFNLEADLLGKYVERLLTYKADSDSSTSSMQPSSVDLSLLARTGFLK